jgi:hypothetical protein
LPLSLISAPVMQLGPVGACTLYSICSVGMVLVNKHLASR